MLGVVQLILEREGQRKALERCFSVLVLFIVSEPRSGQKGGSKKNTNRIAFIARLFLGCQARSLVHILSVEGGWCEPGKERLVRDASDSKMRRGKIPTI